MGQGKPTEKDAAGKPPAGKPTEKEVAGKPAPAKGK